MTNSRAADVARAKALVEQVLATSPRSTLAHFVKGQLLRAEGRCDDAIPEFEMVITSNRNSSSAFFQLAVCKLVTGAIDETIPLEEQSIRLGPRDPDIFNRYLVIGQVHLLQSRTEEAILWLQSRSAAASCSGRSLGGEALGSEWLVRRFSADIGGRRGSLFLDVGEQPGLNRGGGPLPLCIITGETAGLEDYGAQLGDDLSPIPFCSALSRRRRLRKAFVSCKSPRRRCRKSK
jgi:hypothetical protein